MNTYQRYVKGALRELNTLATRIERQHQPGAEAQLLTLGNLYKWAGNHLMAMVRTSLDAMMIDFLVHRCEVDASTLTLDYEELELSAIPGFDLDKRMELQSALGAVFPDAGLTAEPAMFANAATLLDCRNLAIESLRRAGPSPYGKASDRAVLKAIRKLVNDRGRPVSQCLFLAERCQQLAHHAGRRFVMMSQGPVDDTVQIQQSAGDTKVIGADRPRDTSGQSNDQITGDVTELTQAVRPADADVAEPE